MNINNFIQELKRRNVFRVATAYAIVGWLIIQIATSVFPAFEFPQWTIQFVISLTAIGFPIALIFAWAFELTPEGIKKSAEVEITESVTSNTGKKLNRVIISVLSIAVFFLLTERIFFAESSILGKNAAEFETASIAVMPFVNMSSDEENEYFSDGLSEELLNALAGINDMRVAGRTSSFKFKGLNEDLKVIGEELGVANILEGSVRKSGNRLRITAQLIRVEDGFHMWSETYDREFTAKDIFDIQEEISRMVTQELKVRLLPEEEVNLASSPTQDIEAYNAYLEATQLEANRRADEIELAIQKYQDAIRIDPGFALAYSRLAYAYYLLYSYGDLPIEETRFNVRKYAEQALFLDSEQGKAYHAMALYYRDLEYDLEKAEESALKSISLAPNDPFGYNIMASISIDKRQFPESRNFREKAYELDPLNPVIASNYVSNLTAFERYEEALLLLDDIIKRNPDYIPAITRKATILSGSRFGKIDEAFIFLYPHFQANRQDINIIYELYLLSRSLGMIEYMEYFQAEMKEYYPNNTSLLNMEGWTNITKGRYDVAESDFDYYIREYGDNFREYAIGYLNDIYFYQGKYQKWVDLVEEYHPEFLDEDPIIMNRETRFLNYSYYLELLGQT
ncbi:MAG: tetratricopeptide repeat protein, partial [Balneolaceae bacterium]